MASAAAGLGTLLNLDVDTIYQAVGQALHTTTATRQSRKGLISSWKAHAPAFAGKMAIEAVDRAMRGEGLPHQFGRVKMGLSHGCSMVGGELHCAAARAGRAEAGDSADVYQGTLCGISVASANRSGSRDAQATGTARGGDLRGVLHQVESIVLHTSHHTHYVIGTGSGDPQKFDPTASRETLDHSVMYIFAVALEDGTWHHEKSYAPERAGRPETVELWKKVSTVEDPEWTRRYHSDDPDEKAFGARAVITLRDGTVFDEELAVADAHPLGARPFERADYIRKFRILAEGLVEDKEHNRFLKLRKTLQNFPRASWINLP